MIGSFGRRLRLGLHQPGAGEPATGSPGSRNGGPAGSSTRLPEVEFVAYAGDCRLSGRLRLDASRLSDMLNAHDEYLLEGVLAERLPDGGALVVPELLVSRDELILVQATGPRGDRARRTRTEVHGIAMRAGPYLLAGDLHTAPGVDPVLFFRRREPMVPLTDATVEYATAAGPIREFAGTIVVNRDQLDWIQEVEDGHRTFDLSRITATWPGRRGR
jgi:hypothetical protein